MRNEPVKRYLRDALWPLLSTLVVAVLMFHFGESLSPLGRSGFLGVLMLCYVWLGWNDFRHLRLCDELRRRVELEAMMLSFIVATGVILFLFFANAMKLLSVTFDAAVPVMVGSYIVCQLWVRLRYRYWALM